MNLTHWQKIAGKTCECGNWATHFWGTKPICCTCHGEERIDETQAHREHYRIILMRDDAFHEALDKKLNFFLKKNLKST